MKTSTILLIVTLAVTFMAILGFNLVLKAQYEKIDFKDPYYGYTQKALSAYRVVRLQGGCKGLIQLQPGDSSYIRFRGEDAYNITWQMHGDTLELSYRTGDPPFFYRAGDAFVSPPAIYLVTSQLKAVSASGVTCKLTGWQTADWTLQQEGVKSGMLLENNRLETLSASTLGGGLLQMGTNMQVGKAVVAVRDSSSLVAKQDAFGNVRITADSTAHVTLSGALFHQLTQ